MCQQGPQRRDANQSQQNQGDSLRCGTRAQLLRELELQLLMGGRSGGCSRPRIMRGAGS